MKRVIMLCLAVLCLLGSITTIQAQQITQTIRGSVIDKEVGFPIIGATIMLLSSSESIGTSTNEDGVFRLPEIPIGRVNIEVSYIGYETVTLNSILLTAGKELVLHIEIEESALLLEDIVVTAELDKTEAQNDMATVSARSFSVEETSRYAGSFFDPARMAQNYAGVSIGGGSSDLYNEIIVRGNSPSGVLWRMEGIEIPNPNHFASLGNSGGAISMLSSSTLTNSDFYTGAFPAEFGNATAGVFDLKLRTGNNEKREYAFMLGALGVEAAAEGYFSKKSGASYLVNYRYSTLALLKALGLNPVGDILPEYQDLSFKLNFPTRNAGTFALFGLGGANIASFDPEPDSLSWVDSDEENYGFEERQKVGTIGLSHKMLLSNNSYLYTVAIASTDQYEYRDYFLDPEENYRAVPDEFNSFENNTTRIKSTLTSKMDTRNTLRAGVIVSNFNFNFKVRFVDEDTEIPEIFLDNSGNTQLYQGFAQWKHKAGSRWIMNAGLHGTYLGLNGSYSIEPRLGLKYQVASNHQLSMAAGLHSKMEPLAYYFIEKREEGQLPTTPNKNLDLQKSFHLVLGHDWNLGPQTRIKTEAYYQHLYDVPVENEAGSKGSILNVSSIWEVIGAEAVVNRGLGRNIGLDITLEKFFTNDFYWLITASVYESKYRTIDQEWLNTRFNSNYQVRALGGKEFLVGKKKKNTLGFNGKIILAGGYRYTPIDFAQSKLDGEAVYQEDQTFALQYSPYYRLDLGVSYKINTAKMTHTILFDIQNVTNHLNRGGEWYDADEAKVETFYGTGLFPVFNYRIEF